jgi:hypothetical protein
MAYPTAYTSTVAIPQNKPSRRCSVNPMIRKRP